MSRLLSKAAGVLPPISKPSFEVKRSPVWKPNFRTASANADHDPIAGSDAAQSIIYHFQSDGNAYLRQNWNPLMEWKANTTAANADVFAFKCLFKMHEVHGRRFLYSTKKSLKSGGIFVDVVDGCVRVGWYDTVQKQEVWISTSVPVVDPHHWHYLYVRKRFPSASLGSGCWTDTISNLTAASTNDVMVVRRFRKSAEPANRQKPWDYKPHNPASGSGVTFQRNYVGFTTDLEYSLASSPATGLVSRADRTFTGTALGVTTASAAIYSEDMVGMYHWFGGLPNSLFVISSVSSTTSCTVVEATTGNVANLSSLAASSGAVYSGVKLVKSSGFASSQNPDKASYDIELFGSSIAADKESGVMPFVGEFASFAYGMFTGATPAIFEAASTADNACDGADAFNNVEIYTASLQGPDELSVDNSASFCSVNTQPYAGAAPTSKTPNELNEVVPDSGPSSSLARPIYWQFLSKPINLDKRRRACVAFYDPQQAQVSSAGPEIVIQPGGDDASNPSGSVSIVFSDLPVSRDPGPIETRVYMTLPDGGTFYLAAAVKNGASSVAVSKSDFELVTNIELEADNGKVPECAQLEIESDVLVCGDLKNIANDENGDPVHLPDGIIFSKTFQPTAMPGDNLFALPGGSPGITGMRSFNGKLVVAKRQGFYRCSLRQQLPQREEVSPSIGAFSGACMVTHENVLFFWGSRGPHVYDGSGIPRYIGASVRELFQSGAIDPLFASRSVGAVNKKRNQVSWTLRESQAEYVSHRLSMEVSSNGIRFSRYEAPCVTAMSDYDKSGLSVASLVAGDEFGFVLWMDRSDTPLVGMGLSSARYGSSSLVASSGATTLSIPVSGTVDYSLAGPMGLPISYGSSSAYVLFAESGVIYLDKPTTSAATSGQAVKIGAVEKFVETKWYDLGVPEQSKKLRYLSVLCTKGSASISVYAYKDYGATAYSLIPHPNASPSSISTASDAVTRFDLGHLQAKHVKFRFSSFDDFEIIEAVLRISDADQY